ncbi:hypothetical protein VU11_01555 [Desulfobulbus sp. US2]|nr:hypothetical protein [Desulfobulbus sp. US4]MCW5207364.1 hypothetical protein [Desulfobulbus sp. US2]
MDTMNTWIEHLHHPLVFAGFGLFIFALLLRPLFLNNSKLTGTATERLLHKAMILVFILALLAIIGGIALNWKASGQSTASTEKAQPVMQQTNRRAMTALLSRTILEQITIEDLRVIADLMARDIITQQFLYDLKKIPVIAVKPIENKSTITIDPDIIQKTMRVKLMERAGGRLLFRDEVSHQYTIDERMKQSGKVQVFTTTVGKKSANPSHLGQQPMQTIQQEQNDTVVVTNEGVAEKRVADVDYFLTGLVYSTTEVARERVEQGTRFFQFQFRLTDAQTTIIMWEKEYTVKREARFI